MASMTRKQFLNALGRGTAFVALAGVTGSLGLRSRRNRHVWQINPFACTQCGQCATACVLKPSAVKCKHDFLMCGYCKLCFGFFQTKPVALNEGAENQMCPTGAVLRRFVEDPYHEYTIDESLCIGCGKCVDGCNAFGNGSLYLQVDQSLCQGCNECSIAAACPSNAFIRLPAQSPYVIKRDGPEKVPNG